MSEDLLAEDQPDHENEKEIEAQQELNNEEAAEKEVDRKVSALADPKVSTTEAAALPDSQQDRAAEKPEDETGLIPPVWETGTP